MVLADTSVWIRALRRSQPYEQEMNRLLKRRMIAGHAFVYGELLIGDRGGRSQMLSQYEHIRQSNLVPHQEVVALVRARLLNGRGAGWIDIHLLASAIAGRLELWTADVRLASLASELGVAYSVPVVQ
jgi:predicted nucleic acid-binding protein